MPFAIAAQLAFPARQSVAIVGDGGFAQLMAELTTAVKYQLPVKIVILKNNSLAEVRFEQKELGNPEYGCELSPIAGLFCGSAFGGTRDPRTDGGERRQVLCRGRSAVHDRRRGGLPAVRGLLCLLHRNEACQGRADHFRSAGGLGHRRFRTLVGSGCDKRSWS